MVPAQNLRMFLNTKVLTAPISVVSVTSRRTILKQATATTSGIPSASNRKTPTKTTSPNRIQTKSTLTLRNATLVIPGTQEIYAPPSIPTPTFTENEAPSTTSVQNARTIPKVVRKISDKHPGIAASDPYNNYHLPRLNVNRFKSDNSPLNAFQFSRKVKTKKLSKYMQLMSPIQEETEEKKSSKPLVLLYPWLMAKDKHVEKYTKLYTDLGIDVLRINITPHDLLRPEPRSHVAAIEVLDYLLDNNQWHKLLIHGLSVGAYGFMEVMTKMEQNEDRYLRIRPRFIGQIWDSPCDLPGLKEGVSRSLSNNRMIQLKIMDALEWFLKIRYQSATRHYVKTQDMYHKNYLNASSLFLYSRADVVASPRIVTDLANCYHTFGFEVFSHVFNQSPHVGHYAKYREDYKANVMAYIHHIGLLKHAGINID